MSALRKILAAAVAATLPACVSPKYVGIRQADPDVVSRIGRPSCAVAASLRPTVRWEPFAGPSGAGGKDVPNEAVSNLTYELRIASAGPDSTHPIVYARDGLKETFHAVEGGLERSKKYLWTVRARFLLDGELRYTSWGAFRRDQPQAGLPDIVSYCFETPAE